MYSSWLHSIKNFLKTLVRKVLHCCPIQRNKVVFLNFKGKGYGDSPKYIAEEIMRRNLPCRMVWLVDDDAEMPDRIKKAERFGMSGFYELSTAKIIINNCKTNIPTFFKKKRRQFYLQTWHGDFALKFIEKEVEDHLSPSYLENSKADSAVTDAVVSGSGSFSKIYESAFWLPEKCSILEYGVARNDIYFREEEFRDELKHRLGFSRDEKILLYAPTFRDGGETDCYNLDFERLRKVLCQSTQADWKIVVRLHPNISKRAGLFTYGEKIINGSAYPDQQELCMVSDVLVTDYSSIMGDFLLMKKPVFLYVPDLDRYASKDTGRGLREFFYRLPLSFCRDQDALEERMIHFDRETFTREVDSFMKTYYLPFDDGHASERIVDLMEQIMHLNG